MNNKELAEWDAMQYKAKKEANRGRNFSYMTDKLYNDLTNKGYSKCTFINGKNSTHSYTTATGSVTEFRRKGYYARVICIKNNLRIKEYLVFYKEK